MSLPFNIVDTILGFLKREKFIEVVGSVGIGEQEYQYTLSERGADKAAEALERNQYVGPTPVPFEDYVAVVKEQSVRQIQCRRACGRRSARRPCPESDHA